MNQEAKMKCAIYVRVSTDKQGDSVENQLSQCQEYISRLGPIYDSNDILEYKDEAVSGYYTSVFDREEMRRAIQDAKEKKFKLLVFKEVSRVGRDKQENPAIIGMFEQYGIRVIAINDNYDSLNRDNITFDILSVLSEQESKKISSRVSSARKQKARRGQWGGEPPIGYFINPLTKKLEIDPDTKMIPQTIFDLYVNHGMGTFKIAEKLNSMGILTKFGNLWSREGVNRVIRNQAYIGNVIYGTRRNALQRSYEDNGKMTKRKVQLKIDKQDWQVVEAAHEPIVDRQTFFKAQKILLARGHDRAPRRAYHPLTGIFFCGKCGGGMVCQKRSFNNKEYRYYICKTYHKYGRAKCDQANINADNIEHTIISQIKSKFQALPTDFFTLKLDNDKEMERLTGELKNKQNQCEKLRKNQKDIFQQRELFDLTAYESEMLTLKNQIIRLVDEMEIVKKQINHLHDQSNEHSTLEYIINEFKELDYNTEELRSILHELISRICIKNGEIHIEYKYYFFRFEEAFTDNKISPLMQQ